MESQRQIRNVPGGWLFLLILFLGSFWTYRQFSIHLHQLDASHRTLEAMFSEQSGLIKVYKEDLEGLKENLSLTESLLKSAQSENERLHQKIALLDQVAEVESTISRLKERNTLLINHIGSLKGEDSFRPQDIKTIEEARKVMNQYEDRLAHVKDRIKEFRRQAVFDRIAAQKERDRIESLAGNNGYLVRNGKAIPITGIPDESISRRNVKIKVSFIE
jgi:chromosome segregation ATPase